MPSHFAPLSSLSFNVISQFSRIAYSFKQSSPSLVTNSKDVEWLRTHTALYECKADGSPIDPRRSPRSVRQPTPLSSVSLGPKPKPLSIAKFVPDELVEDVIEPELPIEKKPAAKKKTAKKASGKKRGRPRKKKD